MTIVISDTAPRIHYTADDGDTVFDIPFEFIENGHVKVYVNEVEMHFDDTPVTNTEYTLIGANTNEVKQVIFGAARVAGDLVVIYRDVPVEDVGDFDVDGVLDVEKLNEAFDDIVVMVQQTEVNVEQRTLRLAPADEPQALNTIPNFEARANKLLGFDAEGQPVAMESSGGSGGGGGGVADDSLGLNGQPGSYYLDRTHHTGLDEIAEINGLQAALDLKAPIASPTFTGDPHSVTPPSGDDDTSIATTAFVQMEIGGKLDDANADGITYGRRNGAWNAVTEEAPTDDVIYGRANRAWLPMSGGGAGGSTLTVGDEPPASPLQGAQWFDSDSGVLYVWYNDGSSGQWVEVSGPATSDTSHFLIEQWGSWTPAITFATPGTGTLHGAQLGRWCKVGKKVDLWFDVTLTAKGTGTGSTRVSGVPFPASNLGVSFVGSVSYFRNMGSASNAGLGCYVPAGGVTYIQLTYVQTNGIDQQTLLDTIVTNTSRVMGSVSYEAA